MQQIHSNRIIATPSVHAREHCLYVQEIGHLQSVEPHISKRDSLPSLLFFIVTKGHGILTCRGKRHSIHAGDCIFINCLEEYSHESSKEDPWELSWVHFYGKSAAAVYAHYEEQGGRFLFSPMDISPFLTALHNIFEEQHKKKAYYEQKCHKYLTDIVTACYLESGSLEGTDSGSTYEKILSIRAYLDENFAQSITLDELSSRFYISKFHLSREFKKINGATVGSYLGGRRISEAKKLLRFTDLSIGSVAQACGIPDINYFTKVFTKYESMTPSSYRKKW